MRRDWRVWFERKASAKSLFTCADAGVSLVAESEGLEDGLGVEFVFAWVLAAFSASRAVVRARRSETEGWVVGIFWCLLIRGRRGLTGADKGIVYPCIRSSFPLVAVVESLGIFVAPGCRGHFQEGRWWWKCEIMV